MQPNGSNTSTQSAENSPRSTVNSTIQAPRRKFVDEGKLRKVEELLSIYLLLSATFNVSPNGTRFGCCVFLLLKKIL